MTGKGIGDQRTSSPVTARPISMRWISDVPSKMVKILELRAVMLAMMVTPSGFRAASPRAFCEGATADPGKPVA